MRLSSGLRVVLLFLSLLAIKLVIAIAVSRAGFVISSVDEFLRLNWAWKWRIHKSFFPMEAWLPLYFYVYGLALQIHENLFWTSRILTFAFSLGVLFYMYRIAKLVLKEEWIALGVVLLTLSLPLYNWLSLAPLSEMMFSFFALMALFHYFRWHLLAKWVDAIICTGSLILGTMVRYEGWLLAALIVFFVAYNTLVTKQMKSKRPLALFSLSFSFMLVWGSHHLYAFGSPFHSATYFVEESASYYEHSTSSWNPIFLGILQGPFLILGLVLLAVNDKKLRLSLGANLLSPSFALMIILLPFLFGMPSVFPERLLLLPLLLFLPFAFVGWVHMFSSPKKAKWAGAIFCGLSLMYGIERTLAAYPSERISKNALEIGTFIRETFPKLPNSSDKIILMEEYEDDWMQTLVASRMNEQIAWGRYESGSVLTFHVPCTEEVRIGLLICRTRSFCKPFIHGMKIDSAYELEPYRMMLGESVMRVKPDQLHCDAKDLLPTRRFQ